MNLEPRRSWRACRAFLAGLEEHAGRASRTEPVDHVDSCPRCAGRLRATMSLMGLLHRLPRPLPPARLGTKEFLSGVYERAGRTAEQSVGPVLKRTLTCQPAPADPDLLAAGAEDMASSLARSLPTGPAPGWLWTRIQAEIRQLIALRRRGRRLRRIRMAGALAASLLVAAVLWRVFLPSPDAQAPRIVFRPLPEPLDSEYSPVGAIRLVGERR